MKIGSAEISPEQFIDILKTTLTPNF